MAKKQFKTESKKLLDMMINSIYTHKEIFLRELISNASDAIDKLYFRSLTDQSVALTKADYEIRLEADKAARTLTVSDNGCGMTKEELENNLGTIARSGSLEFKKGESAEDSSDEIDIIGQFGVGFYSAFMVSDHISVKSRAYGSEEAFEWASSGVDGYTVEPCEKATPGTSITLHLKPDTEEEKYSGYLEEYTLENLVKKYSDYIRYPIRMLTARERLKEGSKDEYESYSEDRTLNSMVPIWKRAQSDVSEEEYTRFYEDKFYDFEAPIKVIRQKAEGTSNYEALLFIPSHTPYDYYSDKYEKGLQLYSSGVLIMEKCKELLPDYFSFVKGLVDSSDLSLNISREMLQHNRQLEIIEKALSKKIAGELGKMLQNDRENYEKFFKAFGVQLKFGVYTDYGMNKELLQDLLLFASSASEKPTTLKEYCDRCKEDQKKIYYATGENAQQIATLPQVEYAVSHGLEVLYLSDDIDEFALQMMQSYDSKEFSDVSKSDLDLSSEEEKEALKKKNEESADLFALMKEAIGEEVHSIRFTKRLSGHPVCLSSEGMLSVNMARVLNRMPSAKEGGLANAEVVLEINVDHPIAEKVQSLYKEDPERLKQVAKILFAQAKLLIGMPLDNAAEISDLVCGLII